MSNLITHIENVVWREASVSNSPELVLKRSTMIDNNPNIIRRLCSRGVHVVAKHLSGVAISMLSSPYENHGLKYVGSGWTSTVLRSDQAVIKIIRETQLVSSSKREETINKLRDLIAQNTACHPTISVPSEVCEIQHPLSGEPVVAVIQPYIMGTDALVGSQSGDTKEKLRAFAEKSLDEMVPNGFAPDLVGQGNILSCVHQGNQCIQLVDTPALEDLKTPNASFPVSVKKLRELAKI